MQVIYKLDSAEAKQEPGVSELKENFIL